MKLDAPILGGYALWCLAGIMMMVFAMPTAAQTTERSNPFAHYEHPAECAQHASRVARQYWRARRPDTVMNSPWGNSLVREAVESTRRCVALFRIAQVPETQLLFLGEAYIAAEQDDKADSAFQRLIAAQTNRSVTERAWALGQMTSMFLHASPARLTYAERYLQHLDALGDSAATERMRMHLALASLSVVADSIPLIGRHARAAVVAAEQQLEDSVRRQRIWDERGARNTLADWYIRRGIYDSAVAVAMESLRQLKPKAVVTKQIFDRDVQYAKNMGTPSGVVSATWWWGQPSVEARYPILGRPMLYVTGFASCGSRCYRGYAVLRQLLEKYASTDLDIVLFTSTGGFFRLRLEDNPEEEAERTRWYYHEFLELPVILGVWKSEFFFRKEDGKRVNVPAPTDQAMFKGGSPITDGNVFAMLVDSGGKVRFSGYLDNMRGRLEHMIDEVFSFSK